MKLPQLRSAPVQRLATPDPATAAAPMKALGDIGRVVGGEIDDFLEERRIETEAADYTNRLSDIENANIDILQTIQSNFYTKVSNLPKGVEIPQGALEHRYDPETDTIVEYVATDEVGDQIYQAFMSDYVGNQIENARSEVVAARLAEESRKIGIAGRKSLFKDHMIKSKARDNAKFKLSLDEAIKRGNESAAMEMIARAEIALGINGPETLKAAQSAIDEYYFINSSQKAETTSEVERLKNQLAQGEWRFDDEVKKSTYTMLVRREENLNTKEKAELSERQDNAFVDAMATVSTDGMTIDQVNQFKWLRPEQYSKLMTLAKTDAATFKTPELTKLWADRQIQAIRRGDYSIVGSDNFQDAKAAIRESLERLLGSADPFTGDNYTQKMSAADYANYSRQIDDLEQIGYENKQVAQGQKQIYLMVAGASQEAFDFNPDKDAERQIALNDALGDYYQYIEKAGPDAEPMKWVQDNLYKYTIGPAKASLMGIDYRYENIRDSLIWTDGGMKIDFNAMKDEFTQRLKNAKATENKTGIDNAEKALSELDAYREAYPLNVR